MDKEAISEDHPMGKVKKGNTTAPAVSISQAHSPLT